MAIQNFQGCTMKTIAVFEAKNRFSELLAAVAHGEEVTITRHGSPVARLVAIGTNAQPSEQQRLRVSDAMQRLREIGASAELGCTVRQALDAGRD
jgi:prevent-host-death family protein